MATAAQLEANAANSQFSTGPRTPEGKAISAANSTKLGLYASQAVLLTEQDHKEFETLTSAYEYELRPYTPVERTLFGQLILAAWNIQRANRLESALAVEGIDPLLNESSAITLHRITTARTRAERTFHKSLKEFRAATAARPEPQPIRRNEANSHPHPRPKIGRNEPCPCRSGRKYKYCCLQNEGIQSSSTGQGGLL